MEVNKIKSKQDTQKEKLPLYLCVQSGSRGDT